jgi:hypothetical protein
MAHLDLLPADLQEASLSAREPVFLLEDADRALDVYAQHGVGMWGWELWARYPDGRHGHYPAGAAIGISLEQKPDEPWADFVRRSVDQCRRTIAIEAETWESDARARGLQAYYCLTPAAQG